MLIWKTAFAVILFDFYVAGNSPIGCALMRMMPMDIVISQALTLTLYFQVKELPTYKDVDFRNNMQKVYVSDEEKEKIMDKLSRDIEVRKRG